MKTLVALVLFVLAPFLRAAEPVIVPNTASPDGTFAIRLTYDPRAEENNEPLVDVPDVQIVATASKIVLAAFPFAADPNSDHQPLTTKIRANWNGDGSTVALSFSERFYTHLLVYQLQGTFAQPESFAEVTLPDTGSVIKAMVPRFKEFRSRWHRHFQGWPGRNTIQFSAGTGALIAPLGDKGPEFWAVYSFTVDISDPGTPVIKRVERVNEDDH